MNPVSRPAQSLPGGGGGGGGGRVGDRETSSSSYSQTGRFTLSEYGDEVHKCNRREDMLLAKRLLHIERQRIDSKVTMRKKYQTTERLIETLKAETNCAKQQLPTLDQYDKWRRITRYNYGLSSGESAEKRPNVAQGHTGKPVSKTNGVPSLNGKTGLSAIDELSGMKPDRSRRTTVATFNQIDNLESNSTLRRHRSMSYNPSTTTSAAVDNIYRSQRQISA